MRQVITFNNKNWTLPTPLGPEYNTNAYIQFSNSTSKSNSPKFVTDVYLKNTYTLEFKIKTPSNNGSKWRQILGGSEAEGSGSEKGINFTVYTNANNYKFGVNWWNYNYSGRLYNDSAFNMSANTEYIFEMEVGTGVTKINGVTQSNSGGNNVSGTLNKPLHIGQVLDDPAFNGQIYYVKITEGNTLVAYYQADNTDNTPGFKNLVSGNKYTNSGSGTVTYGEDA